MAMTKEEKIIRKFERLYGLDYEISKEHSLTPEQLLYIQKYTSVRTCGETILKYRKPTTLDHLYNLIVECLSYGRNLSLEKATCMYGKELGEIKFKECSASKAITLKKMIDMYGEDEGKVRWKSYCDKQAVSNTFEYKQEKYGWTKEQFDEYNASRAVTLDNLVNRHGEEKGNQMFDDYCEKQRYVGITREYFIETYGEKDGMKKYVDMLIAKAAQDGITKTSDKSNIFIDNFSNEINNDSHIKEFVLYDYDTDKVYAYDYINHELKLCIEFNGVYWHMKPSLYKSSDIHKLRNNTASQIWERDLIKKESFLKKYPDYKYVYVWEDEAYHNYLRSDYSLNETYMNELIQSLGLKVVV